MSEQPRDWDRELADIDRLIAKGSAPGGGPSPVPAPRGPSPAGVPPARRASVAVTWFWAVLGLALAAALVIWPYQRACGLQLFFFLGAAGVTGLVGLLGALAAWSHRRGFAHVLSLLVMMWAATVAAREVLPRVGYAKAARTWMCEAAPAGGAPQGTPAPTGAAPSQSPSAAPAPTQPAQPQPGQAQPAPAR